MIKTATLCVILCLTTLTTVAQEKLSGQIYGGIFVPFNDFNQTDYDGYKPNLAMGMALGYQALPYIRVRGDLATGLLNGNGPVNYYETNVYEGSLGFDFNAIRLFAKDYTKIKFNLQAGIGIMMYTARLYNRGTGAKVIESPIRTQSPFSPNAILTYGANVSYALTPKLDVNLSYTNRWTDNVDWMDGQRSGSFSDTYGMANVGLIFYLKSDKDRSKVEIDKRDLDRMIASKDSLGEVAKKGEIATEQVEELQIANQEKVTKIQRLEAKVDTLIAKIEAETDTVAPGASRTPADAEAILANEQFRLIVASLPTEAMAQRWIDRSKLDKSEMVIAYIEEHNTYRVVYKSFKSFPAARKELLNIKSMVGDAWIVKF